MVEEDGESAVCSQTDRRPPRNGQRAAPATHGKGESDDKPGQRKYSQEYTGSHSPGFISPSPDLRQYLTSAGGVVANRIDPVTQTHLAYGPDQTLISFIVPDGSFRASVAHLRQVVSSFVSSASAGAGGPAEPASRTVPSPAGPGRVCAAGPRRRRGGARNHPDPAEPGNAAEQVGQPKHQDGRPPGKSEDSTFLPFVDIS